MKIGIANRKLLINSLIFILIGICFICINTSVLSDIVFIGIAAFIIYNAILDISFGVKTNRKEVIANAILEIVCAILIAALNYYVCRLICAILLLIYPIYLLIKEPDKRQVLINYAPRIILACILILFEPSFLLHVLFVVIGVFVVLIGIVLLIASLSIKKIL